MSGRTVPSLPTFFLDAAAETARNAEYSGTPFSDITGLGTFASPYLGVNRGGSCAPGLGIATGLVFQNAAEVALGDRPEGWTELDQGPRVGDTQTPVARIPQDSQHLGGSGLGDGDQSSDPVRIADLTVGSVDVNDTANFVITDTAAVDGAVMDTVSGAINDTGATVGIGDLIWGKVPVA